MMIVTSEREKRSISMIEFTMVTIVNREKKTCPTHIFDSINIHRITYIELDLKQNYHDDDDDLHARNRI